jgi:hypothetical protein
MKNTGIWLDKEKALIIKLNNDKEDFVTIESNIEHYSIKSNKDAGGPNEKASDSKFMEREKNQFKEFFESIIPEINDSDALVIYGPAETYLKFRKELQENHNTLNARVKGAYKADSMTKNQTIALVKDFFKTNG